MKNHWSFHEDWDPNVRVLMTRMSKEAICYLKPSNDGNLEGGWAIWSIADGSFTLCGRYLTNPESIERGIGPVCAEKSGW